RILLLLRAHLGLDQLSFPTRRSSDLIEVGSPGDRAYGAHDRFRIALLEDLDRVQRLLRRLEEPLHLRGVRAAAALPTHRKAAPRSEAHTSQLQSRENLVCRLLLESKK